MLHLKVYLRFHFKKHRNLQRKKTVKKKMHLTSLDGAVKGAPLISNVAPYVSFISYATQNKQNC